MKSKILLSFLAVALVAIVPSSSLSSDKKADSSTITLSEDNVIVLNSQVDGESVSRVISEAKALDAKLSGMKEKVTGKRPIYLFLNTPGGSIQSGLEMIEALHGLGRPVHTITLFAASMGFQIAQNLDTRYIIQNGVMMSHRARGGFEGEFGGQAPSQIESRYALWKSRLDEMDNQTVSRTNGKQTLASYQKQYASEMWLTGDQSVAQGYSDKVVKVKCDSSLAGTTHQSAQVFIFQVEYDLDKCPLNTSPMNIKVGFVTNKGGYMNETDFINKGGQFGPSCLTESVNNKDRLCALDTSLNMEKIKELKAQFMTQYSTKMRQVVDSF